MGGAKPKLDNVVGFPGGDTSRSEDWHRDQAIKWRPRGLSRDERREWERVAVELSKCGRLHGRFVDVIREYVGLIVRMQVLRKFLATEGETYESSGRQGIQYKSRPEVAQLNDDWRKWRSLMGELGLSPASERGLSTAQGDLFDNPFANLDEASG